MRMRVIVLFPEFENGERIEEMRRRWDPLADEIPPHLTLVFPFESEVPSEQLEAHAREALAGVPPLRLVLQGVTGTEGEYLFLNVKRGNDEVIELHDRLYTGPLAPFLRRDHTFLPHLTVGRLPGPEQFLAAVEAAASVTYRFVPTRLELVSYRIEVCGTRPVEWSIPLAIGASPE